jgi:hypothetical protein
MHRARLPSTQISAQFHSKLSIIGAALEAMAYFWYGYAYNSVEARVYKPLISLPRAESQIETQIDRIACSHQKSIS